MAENFEPLPRRTQDIANGLLDAASAVHRTLGPGLLESTYEICLEHELRRRGHDVQRQVALPVVYDTIKLDAGYRIDLIVDRSVIVDVKSVEVLATVHEAQVLTYLKLSERRLGYLINLNVALLKQGHEAHDPRGGAAGSQACQRPLQGTHCRDRERAHAPLTTCPKTASATSA